MPEGTPQKVEEIADAIRRENPEMSDEAAYRIAWDTYKGKRGEKPETPIKQAAWQEGFLETIKLAQSVLGAGPGIASTLPQPAQQPYRGMLAPDNSLVAGLPSLAMTDQEGTAQISPGHPATAGAKPQAKAQQGYNPTPHK